ncbi:hypothetical protein K8Q94_02130 [Candidatus Nomurabacteria bacterium]|nr:hypothetical protein [Candidatus Nomurabacteria bacterium]
MKKYLGLFIVLIMTFSLANIAKAEDGASENSDDSLKTGLQQERQDMREGIKENRLKMRAQILGDKQGLKEDLKNERDTFHDDLKSKMDAFKIEVEKQKSDFKTNIKTKRSEFRKNAEEVKTTKFTGAITSIEAIQTKLSERIAKMTTDGKDTKTAKEYLDASVKDLADAKIKIAEIKIPTTDTALTADDFAQIKITVRDARNLLEKAKNDLQNAIKSLKTANTAKTSAENTNQ